MTNPIVPLARAFARHSVKYVLIGVSGANFYAPAGQAAFVTRDYDLFLPPDEENPISAWGACEDAGMDVWLGNEPLDRPRDRWLAERIIVQRILTRVSGPGDLAVDLSLIMKGFDFETVWKERRLFVVDDVEIPTARLIHIIISKQAAGRDKDRLFLATHRDALEQLLKKHEQR